jgi:hypothetical protein
MGFPAPGAWGVVGAGWFRGGLVPRHIPAITTSQFDDPRVGSRGGGGGPRLTRVGGVVASVVDPAPLSPVDVEPPAVPDEPGVEVSTRMVTWLSVVDPSMLRHSPAFRSA